MNPESDRLRDKLRRIEPLVAQAAELARAMPPWANRMAARKVAEQRRACPIRQAIQTGVERRG